MVKLDGSLWNAYRRKWGAERKGYPVSDVKEAGGRSDTRTPETCHQLADEQTTMAVIECPNKLKSKNFGYSA